MDSSQKNIEDLLGKKFIRKKSYFNDKEKETKPNSEECNCDEFTDCKFVLLFFSAGWCAPCDQFLQVLKDFYSEVNINEKNVEVIYVTCDRDEASFKESYTRMPWLSFPFSSPKHEQLKKKFDVIGVPIVLVCDAKTGFLVTQKGRKDIFDLGVQCLKNWTNDLPNVRAKQEYLDRGKAIVEKQRKEEEAEAKRKAQLEKDME